MEKAEIRKVVRRVKARKGIPERIEKALDAVCEPFWTQLSSDTRRCDVPEEFLLDLALELLDQAGLSVEAQKAAAKALVKAG